MEAVKRINRKLLVAPKLIYFFVYLQYYTLHQFRSVFAQELFDVDNGTLGTYLGTLLCLIFFTNIFVGAMNDKFGRSNIFILVALLMTGGFFQLFFVGPYMNTFSGMFWVNMFCYLAFNNGIPPLLDKAILDYLNRIPEAGARAYGRQKLYGTAAYALSSTLIERSIKTTSSSDKITYSFGPLRVYSVITTALAGVTVFFLLKSSSGSSRGARQDILAGCKELLRNSSYSFFIFIIFLNGITRQVLSIYQTVYFSQVLQLKPYKLPASWPAWVQAVVNVFNRSPVGTTTQCGMLFEVVLLFYSPKITQKMGLVWPILISQLFQVFRVFCYFILNHTNEHVFMYSCLIELTRGVYFGLLSPAAVQMATNLCPPHLKSTSQMIYQGTFTALGAFAGGHIFGKLFDKAALSSKDVPLETKVADFSRFFLVNTCFAAVTTALFVYKYLIMDKIRGHNADTEKQAIIEAQSEPKAVASK